MNIQTLISTNLDTKTLIFDIKDSMVPTLQLEPTIQPTMQPNSTIKLPVIMESTPSIQVNKPRIKLVMIEPVEDIQALIDKIEPSEKHPLAKYNFENFIALAKFRFKDRYLYYKIRKSDIDGSQSIITVVCNICKNDLIADVTNFLNGKRKCRKCYTFLDDDEWEHSRFVNVSKDKFGPDSFNYDLLIPQENISGKSLVVLTCNNCSTTFPITAQQHLKRNTGCVTCTGKITYDEIIFRGKKYHNGKIDYSRVPRDIKGLDSEITISCIDCGHIWPTIIRNHLTEGLHSGCPNCSGRRPWTLERFLAESIAHNGSRYDYSRIKPEDIKTQHSPITIGCTICGVFWPTTVQSHAYFKTQCLTCQNKAHWDLQRVLATGHALFGAKYDYSKVTSDMIVTNLSRIPVTCNDCGYYWTPKINSHLNDGKGCTECANHKLWSYPRFLNEAESIHMGAYDYSEIDPNAKIIGTTNVPIRCKNCDYRWTPTVASHIYERTGCYFCQSSKGEKACVIALTELKTELGIVWNARFQISPFDFIYDFVFQYQEKRFIIEFDGIQHFKLVEFFKQTQETFEKNHQVDLLKTRIALEHGFQMIRIDHKEINNIKAHILEAIKLNNSTYYTNPDLYKDFPKV